jgi:glycosyltransferase involved in cell wall biosynthesis
MGFDRIIFWQDVPSPHQAPWIRALAEEAGDCQIEGMFMRELYPERVALGWQPPDYGKAHVVISPAQSEIDRFLGYESGRTVHIFSSMVHIPAIHAALRRALSSEAVVGILSEGRDWRGVKGVARQLHALLNERNYRRSVDFVLAIGRMGACWYKRCGYDRDKIFPFCYAVETPVLNGSKSRPGTSVQLIAVGQLIHRKRLDLLLNSLKNISALDWTLKIIGDGDLRFSLEAMTEELGLGGRVIFTGVMDNRQVRRELSQADMLVLPSHWDGWGAVVNEALMAGVPVICSDFCGAADLIKTGFNGEVFPCDCRHTLTRVMQEWISRGPLPHARREQIRQWSGCISGLSVARYFLDVLRRVNGDRECSPMAPWRLDQETE